MLRFSTLFVCFHIIWSRRKNLCFVSFHSPVRLSNKQDQAHWRQSSLCNLSHGLSETILAKTHARNSESDSYQLCLKNVSPQRHSFNVTHMRNKPRQSHNFWSVKSSIQIMHETLQLTWRNMVNAGHCYGLSLMSRTPGVKLNCNKMCHFASTLCKSVVSIH